MACPPASNSDYAADHVGTHPPPRTRSVGSLRSRNGRPPVGPRLATHPVSPTPASRARVALGLNCGRWDVGRTIRRCASSAGAARPRSGSSEAKPRIEPALEVTPMHDVAPVGGAERVLDPISDGQRDLRGLEWFVEFETKENVRIETGAHIAVREVSRRISPSLGEVCETRSTASLATLRSARTDRRPTIDPAPRVAAQRRTTSAQRSV